MDQVTGGCLCGAVRITAKGQPYRVGICHCLDCRKHHGAPFYAWAIFPETAVTIEGDAVLGRAVRRRARPDHPEAPLRRI